METITTRDGTVIFYQDWSSRSAKAESAIARRSRHHPHIADRDRAHVDPSGDVRIGPLRALSRV